MLRKFAARTSAAVVAAGLAAAPAVATALPGSPAEPCGAGVQTEETRFDPETTAGFVFGPAADVPHLRVGDPDCLAVASTMADMTSAKRNNSSPPPVGTPVPEEPSSPPPSGPTSPPPGDSGPPTPGPGDSGPPPAAPPVESAGPPAAPELMTPPAPVEPTPTTRGPAESGKPSETVLPTTEPRLPQTAADSRPLAVAGGASLVAAGLAWIGGARRRKRLAD